MTYKTHRIWDRKSGEYLDARYVVNQDGSTTQETVISNEHPAELITPDADLTQIITVTTAGTPVPGPNKTSSGGWMLKAGVDNTDTVYFMFLGQTKANKGFPLNKGESLNLYISNLNSLDFDADSNGDKIYAVKVH